MTASTPDAPANGPQAIPRLLDLRGPLARKSHFLFGPRQTGKTWLIRHALPEASVYDLLDSRTFLELSQRPSRLEEGLGASSAKARERAGTPVVIDEIQRLPGLLNEVHRLIESRGVRFLLTGSSARGLRRGGVNLLGGRARTLHLHPFSARELSEQFDLTMAIARGLLPPIYFSDDPAADLAAYTGTYLQQEIVAAGAARNAEAFSRFLHVAALTNATVVNFTKVANDAQVPRTTVHEYYEILRDTLLIHEVPAWRQSLRRKPIASSKWYFFDVGVASALQGRLVRPATPEFGGAFETWLAHELRVHRDCGGGLPIAHWRSTSGFEVDFVLGDHVAIEAKASANVSPQDLRGLRAIGEEAAIRHRVCVCLEARPRLIDGVRVLPWAAFLDALWAGEFAR